MCKTQKLKHGMLCLQLAHGIPMTWVINLHLSKKIRWSIYIFFLLY
jgi:hypothetical protein